MKVVINRCFGGFSLSRKAVMRYAELSGFKIYSFLRDGFGQDAKETLLTDDDIDSLFIHYRKGTTKDSEFFSDRDIDRSDPVLVRVVEELGQDASGRFANLKVVEIPDGIDYEICEYDGNERIAEKHRTWA